MFDQQLMDYFKFDPGDLEANRNGRFTDKQKARLSQEAKTSKTWGIIIGGVLLLIGLGGLAGAIAAGIATPDWGFRIGFGLGFGCIWPVVWGGLGWVILRSSFSKKEFKLAKVQGRVNIIKAERTSHHTDSDGHSHTSHYYVYELHVGGQSFDVQGNLADIIMQGDEYVFYYIDGSDEIMSAELVSKAK